MEGYKTLLLSAIKILSGALIAGGVMDESQRQVVLDNIDSIIGRWAYHSLVLLMLYSVSSHHPQWVSCLSDRDSRRSVLEEGRP